MLAPDTNNFIVKPSQNLLCILTCTCSFCEGNLTGQFAGTTSKSEKKVFKKVYQIK